MREPVITVKNISKSYNISHEMKVTAGNVTFRDAIINTLKKPKELLTGHIMKKEKFWALKGIDFEINKGEVVGIIGKNGSGKSTLLKIMSRITEPTTGEIVMNGKVASLLEVGTGFHPELTGRENVYFNGSILGMKKKEIDAKFDEIVAFSEVEKFLDTPVKFYSSGMYVRLAFAVAAHLDPDILIVDEVLAVGDAAFQKKCLGKMKQSAAEGRTVIFVSHSMNAVKQLCKKAILLDKGKIKMAGNVEKVFKEYNKFGQIEKTGTYNNKSDDLFASVELLSRNKKSSIFTPNDPLEMNIFTKNNNLKGKFSLEFRIKNSNGEIVGFSSSLLDKQKKYDPGNIIKVKIDKLNLIEDSYIIDLIAREPGKRHFSNWWDEICFDVKGNIDLHYPINVSASDNLGSFILEEVEYSNG